ncbi:MAG TPA: hypothetical protein VGM17_02675 [Rhizomicrobium sp.]|jgi:hypothetical protein
MNKLVILLFATSLSACGLIASPQQKAEARTPNYRAGYDDGCAAASTEGANPRAKPYRDEALFNTNHAYHAGWVSGFGTCRNPGTGSNTGAGSAFDNPAMNPPTPH